MQSLCPRFSSPCVWSPPPVTRPLCTGLTVAERSSRGAHSKMAYRQLVRRALALSVRNLRCSPVTSAAPLSSWRPPGPPVWAGPPPTPTLSRSLSLTSTIRVTFNVQDAEDFTDRVINSNLPVLVDFHAHWCGPCKILGPRLEKAVAKQQGRVTMAKVNIDEHADLAIEYEVSAVPTVIAMQNGQVIDRFVGVIDEDQIESFLGKLTG
ncbi:hypothetical protein GJAV_G00144520 [Gymnothorax javanicus]|nr:hypothetical protein GJAV_G00144520 [Gymnothorax javanicus]